MRPAAAYASAATYRPKAAYDSSVYNRTTRIHAYLHAPRTQILSARIALSRNRGSANERRFLCARGPHARILHVSRTLRASTRARVRVALWPTRTTHTPRVRTLPNKHTHITCALRGSLFYNKAVERQCAPHNLPYRAMSVPPASAGGVSPSPYRGAVQRKPENYAKRRVAVASGSMLRDRPTQPPYQRGSGVR